MIHVLSLFACVSPERSDLAAAEAALAVEVDCSGIAEAVAEHQLQLDAAGRRVEIARLIAHNYDELFALALRSAASVTRASERGDNALEAAARLEEAIHLAREVPELAPAALGVEQIDLTTSRGAAATIPLFVDATAAAAEVVGLAEGELAALQLPFSDDGEALETCGFPVPELPEPAFDTDPVGDALVANVEEALALVAAIQRADAAVTQRLQTIHGFAEESASESLGDSDRRKLQRRFERAVGDIELVVATATFNDYAIATGVPRVRETITDPGAGAEGRVTVRVPDLSPARLGVDLASVDLSTWTGANSAFVPIGTALQMVHRNQAHLGDVGTILELERSRLGAED